MAGKSCPDEWKRKVGGLECWAWLDLWSLCHEGTRRIEWPDGKSLLKQPAILVHMFYLILEQIASERELTNGKHTN